MRYVMTIKSNATQVLEQLILVLFLVSPVLVVVVWKEPILVTVLICHLMYLFH